jgi:hypothetical protein
VTVGHVSQTFTFSMTIISHCEPSTLIIMYQPEPIYYYVIGGAPMIIFNYDITTIVQTSGVIHCGEPVIDFVTSIGFEIEIIFDYSSCTSFICDLTVYCIDLSCVGEYEL